MSKHLLLAALLASAATGAMAGPVEPTTITNGQFAPDTKWYTMQITAQGFYLSNELDELKGEAMPLQRTSTLGSDGDMWCFVGNDADGYKIYNRAGGTDVMLAAPADPRGTDNGGSAYVTLKAPGITGQSYLWNFSTSNNLTGQTAYYINEQGQASYKINNRGNRLAFWTAGADGGSSVVIKEAVMPTLELNGGAVTVSTDPLITLSGSVPAERNADGSIKLGDCVYKFSSDNGYVVREYMIRYADGSTKTAVSRGESNDQLPVQGPANIVDIRVVAYPELKMAENGYVIFRYDKTPGFTISYRIPSIVTVMAGEHKGRLVSLNDYRYCGGDIGAGRIDLYMTYSDDNGATWSVPDVMRNAQGRPVAMGTGAATPEGQKQSVVNLDCGFGDPATVSDRETGEILAVACAGRMNFFASRRDDPQPSARWWSKDGGLTWTEPDFGQWEQIYALFDGTCANGYIDGQFVGSGRMIQSSRIKVGSHYRVYCVMSGHHAKSGNVSNWVLYSDDFGHNWHVLGDPMNPGVTAGGDEPKCEELPDGSILLAARGNGGGRNFNIFRYTDQAKAQGQWATHINTNLGLDHGINACNGEIMIVPVKKVGSADQAYMAIQSFPNSTRREKVTLAWKVLASGADFDEPSDFTKWNGFMQLSEKSSCYSTMTWQADNALGVVFEESSFGDLGGGYCEVYRRITINELTDGAWEYCPDTDGSVARRMTEEIANSRATEQPGEANVVGYLTNEGAANIAAALAAYKANPNDDTYTAFNAATLDPTNRTLPLHGAVYTFKSDHGGLNNYPAGNRWLSATASELTTATSATDATKFTLIQPEGSDYFYLYNAATKRFVENTPERTETAVPVNASSLQAGLYRFKTTPGQVSIISTTPGHGGYPAVHMNSGGKPVIWTIDVPASKWVMTFVEMASELPKLEESGIGEVETAAPATERYFDLQGRPVAAPRRGQIVVTDNRRKLIF